MTGRHRRTRTTTAQRALAGTVPALGLVGLATAAAAPGPEAASESPELVAAVPSPPPDPGSPAELAPGEPAVTGVAATAARAADRTAEQRRVAEGEALTAVVDDVRADARARDAEAARQGRRQLDEFQQDVARQSQDPAPAAPWDDTDVRDGPCDLTGLPRLGDEVDPDEIVDRDCGMTDLFGRQRSTDPWIDGQLLTDRGE